MSETHDNSAMEAVAMAADDKVFSTTALLDEPLDEVIADLSQGLSAEDAAFIAEAATELSTRLKPKRFAHSVSVARTMRRFAGIYGLDLSQSVRAGLIHDWDKCYVGDAAHERVRELGIELPWDFERMEALLHSITGAKALGIRFPHLEPEVLQAVERHTSGAVDMTELDMALYVADMIEPTRAYEKLVPLRELIGEVSLPELFAECFCSTVEHLVERRRFFHPETANIWNAWVGRNALREWLRRQQEAEQAN
ncbi:MAG: bis(5'-nucleosyl)-tetraphosphatase (symmetrical) YqeK [Coriobacteriales bacterium]|jgi:predicted HD superfamily hydrolase involved in NAD metabolism